MGVKMRVSLCLLLLAACALAEKNGNAHRRTKPFVADAVGNTLPPPSNVPATVGSPISLLTPDKYEFYTFDESGELVKRLMTLEEIQAIVAAGEDSEGVVTFANDNQPTIAFNFSQAPYTKVHSVVTNVQNVLKAQMEAQKNKPPVKPTLDTPDVSDTWSLILPSIFGNSGVDIVPEKATNNFTPETETIENFNKDDSENSLSKEGDSHISSSISPEVNNEIKATSVEPTETTISSTTSTTSKPTTTRKATVKPKPISTTTVRNKLLTTTRPRTTTTKPTSTTRLSTTTTKSTTKASVPKTTTRKTSTASTNTKKPAIITTTTTRKITTTTTESPSTKEIISNDIPTAKPVSEYEKISTFIPVSTVKYVTERTTERPIDSTKAPFVYAPTTKRSPSTTTKLPQPVSSTEIPKLQTTAKVPTLSLTTISTSKVSESDKVNLTTVTTQSVSPSTTVSSTEYLTAVHTQNNLSDQVMKDDGAVIPLFDVAQSISQIASDLGNSYQPLPSTSNFLDSTKISSADMESKEDLDMDMPSDELLKTEDNFIKISTIDPHPEKNGNVTNSISKDNEETTHTTESVTTTEVSDISTILPESTTIDAILSGSMEDLLSQVVNEAPKAEFDTNSELNKEVITDNYFDTTTMDYTTQEISTELSVAKNNTSSVTNTENNVILESTQAPNTFFDNEIPVKTTDKLDSIHKNVAIPVQKFTTFKVSTENQAIDTTTEKMNKVQITTEKSKIVAIEKVDTKTVITKVNSDVNNSLGTETQEKEVVKDYIKVSESNNSNTLSKEQMTQNVEKVKQQIDSNINVSLNNEIKTNKGEDSTSSSTSSPQIELMPSTSTTSTTSTSKPKAESTLKPLKFTNTITPSPKIESTPEPSKFTNNKNNTISTSSSNKNNIPTVNKPVDKVDKISDTLPKVEEFKKKIQKVNDEELNNDRNEPWKLIPTVIPPKANDVPKDKTKPESNEENKNVLLEFSKENQGLEVTTKDLGEDIAQFTELCNELAFRYWNKILEKTDKKRSFVLSPYSITSMLAMMFMGAKGATSGEMNEILKLDDMVTFNPHFTLKNISDSIDQATNSGIAVSAFVRELFSDRNKGKILTFYKERAQHFYSGHVEEINFKLISDIIRRRTNLLVKKHTWGKIPEFMKTNSIVMKPPLAAFSTNIFQTDCTGTSVDGRDGEMYFVVSPNVRQRRLVPVPAVVYKSGFLAGYDPALDATAAALGNTNSIVSTIFLMPGQQGNIVHADDLEKLESRLLESDSSTTIWSRVLRTLLPRIGLELQIPRFAHKSVFNVSSTLRDMGLKELFDAEHADLGGLNGPSKDLYLSDMVQLSSFVTCGEGLVDEQHHIEEYPEAATFARRRTSRWADWDEPRDYQRAFHDPHDVIEAMHLPLHLRPRQARVPTRSVQPARLKFDRPFLFFVRHNPSGMILYVGRYNPRLLP